MTADQFVQYHQFGISPYGENHVSAKFSSHKLGITQKQNEKGTQSSCSASRLSVLLAPIYLKESLKMSHNRGF